MILVILTALAVVCGAAKLDKSYVPPISAKTAGGSPGALLTPLDGSNQGLPTGSYTNEVQGVVVDAVNPGTRTSGQEPTGLGGPRISYGSTDSKVGDAAFSGSLGSLGPSTRIAPGFGSFVDSDGTRSDKTSSLKFTSDVGLENYSYGFETDNGISVGENGVAADGVKAQGGYSYKGDDGKTYSVSYTADEGGYKPQGHHLPTPPPIPNEILISLEKNAKEEAAGHVDDGSYNAQKYYNEGDYSSNGASNNNGRPTIGGGDAKSSGSHVSQSSQVHRPTSGVLSGAYNPGSDAIYSSQGQNAQGFDQSGNKQTSLSHGSSSQGAQTENRFGVQATQSEGSQAHAQASVTSTPVRSQTFNSPGASAFSSAVATGSGSSSAFASTGPLISGFKNEYISPLNSFGSTGQNTHDSKSDSSTGASVPAPSTATASASVSGSQTQVSGFHKYGQSSSLPSSASASASTSENQHSFGHSNQQVIESNSNTFPTRFGESQKAGSTATIGGYLPPINTIQSFGKPNSNSKPQGFDSSSAASSANIQPLSQHSSQTQFGSTYTQSSGPQSTQASLGFGSIQGPTKVPDAVLPTPFESNAQSTSVFTQQSSNQVSHSSGSNVIPLSLPTPATAVSSTTPFVSQQPGNDNSYYYQQPSKPFITPLLNSNSQYFNNQQPIIPISSISQQGSKYPNVPALSATGQYQGTSSLSYNGITQAAISPFTSDSSSSSTQFASQSSQFGSKPSTQLSLPNQQTSTQIGSTETHSDQKPIVQSQTQFGQPLLSFNVNSGSYESTTQQNQGTIYQYNKPISTLPAQGQKDTSSNFGQASLSQTDSQGKPGQVATNSRFGTQQGSSQFGSQSTFQQAQIGSNTLTQFGQKPIVSSQVSGSNYQQSQVGNFGSQFGQKPQATQGSIVSSNTNTQTSFGSTTNQFGQKPQTVQGTGLTSTFGQTSFGQKPSVITQTGSSSQQGQFGSQFGSKPTTQGGSYTYSQSQTSEFGKKPVSTIQGSTLQQAQFGVSGSQFSQNSQSTGGSVSTTAKPSYVQKPFGSSYQQTQVGTSGSQSASKPQSTIGSSFTYGQSQTSQLEKKPVISTTQTGSQFGQNSQSTHGSGSTSTTSQTSFGIKPVYQQSQFGSQYSQSQTSVYGKKPISTTQRGITSQQNQYGSTGFQFGQNSQNAGTGLVSTTVKPTFGSTYPQSQFGSFGSQFGSKPQTTQGSSFTYNQASSQTSQFGKKPVSTTQIGVTSQQTQFGSSGSQFGQNSQTTAGSGLVSTTAKPSYNQKPFGSTTYQQSQFGSVGSQFGSKPQTSQGSSFTYNQASSQTSQFGKKPVSTTQTGVTSPQTQFGSSGSQFGQNSQTTVGSGLVSTTVKPSYNQKPFGSTTYPQSQFGSVGSQFGSKPQTTQGSSFTYNQASSQTSQFGKKPVSTTQTGVTSQQTQFGSSGSQFGQNSQTTVGSGLVSTTVKPSYNQKPFGSTTYPQSQFGSVGTQFGSTPQTSQGSSFTYSQASSQTSQFGKKPVSTIQTGVTSQQTQFGSSGSQFGQNSQSTQGSAVALTTPKPVFAIKPVYQQPQFASSGSKFGQSSQSTQGFSTVTTTAKPSYGQTSFGLSSQQTQFGSQFGQKPQTSQGSSFTSNTYSQSESQFGKKPSVTGTAFPQTQFGSGSFQSGQKPLTTTVTGVTSTTTPAPFGQKPSSTAQTGSYYQQSQFGSIGSQFGQKPQTTPQGSLFTSNTGSNGQVVQTSQFGVTGSSQNTGSSFQSTQFGTGSQGNLGSSTGLTSQSGNKVSGSSSASGFNFQQNQFAGSSGSQFGQTTQTTQRTISQAQPVQSVQNGIKPFGTSQNTQGSTQFTATPSRFGGTAQTNVPTSTTISHPVQPSQFGQTPSHTQFGTSFGHFGQKPQASTFATSSSSNVIPFGSTQVTGQVSKYQQTSQFGSQYQGVTSTQKPLGSSLSPTNYQQYQYSQNSDKSGSQSQYGQGSNSNVGSGQFGHTTFGAQSQKPFGSQSTQTTYQQTQFTQGQKPFGSFQGSAFQTGQSVVDQPTQGTVQTINVAGYNYQKPQTGFTTQYGGQASGSQEQKVQQTQSNLNSVVSTTQAPITGQSYKPFEISSTQGAFQQSQSTVGSSLLGTQQIKPTEFTGPIIQTSYNQFSGQPFKPASTASTQGSTAQSQASAVSTSQFGSLHGSSIGSQTVVGSKPQYNVLPSHGVVLQSPKPSHFSVEPFNTGVSSTIKAPSFPSRVGSNEDLVVSTVQVPIVPIPGYEIVTSAQGSSHGLAGLGEEFGGPRIPPRFDDKTGYHY